MRGGLSYTSIAPPRLSWADIEALRPEATRTGARIVLATGLEPGVTSMLVRAAVDRLGNVDEVETALMLSLSDDYGTDSMAYIFGEVSQPYPILVDGKERVANAFERPKLVAFPAPIGARRAYTMPFTDQFYYAAPLGATTAVARIALDPPWLAPAISVLLPAGLRRALKRGEGSQRVRAIIEKLRTRYAGRDRYALVVEVRGGNRMVRATMVGRKQADATAAGAAAVTEALWSRECATAGVWLAEQCIAPERFLERIAAHELTLRFEETSLS